MNFIQFMPLITDRLLMRELQTDDAEEIFLLRSDEKVNALIDRQTTTSMEEAKQFINKIITAQNNKESIMWVITLKDNPKLIGTIVLYNLVKEKAQAEIGYELLPEYRSKGIMYEALLKVIDFTFNTLDLKTIVADLKAINKPSVDLLEKCGFIKAGETDYGYLIYELHS